MRFCNVSEQGITIADVACTFTEINEAFPAATIDIVHTRDLVTALKGIGLVDTNLVDPDMMNT
jgi:hypothetical protein